MAWHGVAFERVYIRDTHNIYISIYIFSSHACVVRGYLFFLAWSLKFACN